jgi:eukaryotic-like serine/threonine-protein kinase
MTPERWQEIRDVLDRALEVAPGARSVFLDQACSSDQSLRHEVEALLDPSDHEISGFLQPALAGELGDALVENLDGLISPGPLQAGQLFAERFQLVRKLGEGGMGQVWLADQTSPVRRQVALKLIKAGMYDEALVQRFQAERQSLAIMDHPAIAKVFDAGTTPQGQPYFVMEYVPGLPITEYCDQKKLKIRDRLELFIRACEGVQHAHQKAIIHRDLKPANILVIEVDGKPVPRIIDFGLAKATTPQAEGESIFTHVGHFVGTPGYMSPEQADPNVHDIDTRTDVYSLGAVLYVLLSGSQPFSAKPGQKLALDELLRKMREEEPPSPSDKVSSDRDTSSDTAEARGTEPKQLVSQLRGDLDWITMKALEKDRARRYGASSELAADIRRYLNHEAIVARPASTAYRLRKYARRHRATVGVAAGLAMLLATFSVLQAVELRRITRERDRANSERDRATRITDFMTNMFKVSDPSQGHGSTVTAREILDKASKEMGTGLAKDPDIQSQMMEVMATTYTNLGLYLRAQELATRAVDLRTTLHGPEDPNTLQSVTQLGYVLFKEGRYAEAEKLERQALASERRILGSEDPQTAQTSSRLAAVLATQGHNDEVEKLRREALEIDTRKLGPDNPETLKARGDLGNTLSALDRLPEAEQEYRSAVEADRRVLGPDSAITLRELSHLATAIQAQGRAVEAEPLFREVLADEQRVLGRENPDVAFEMVGLAEVLQDERRLPEAEKYYRDAAEIRSRTLGPEHLYTLNTKSQLAYLLLRENRLHEAENLQREMTATEDRVLGLQNPFTLSSQSGLAEILVAEGKYAQAEKIAREALKGQLSVYGPLHPQTLGSLRQLGKALAHTHRYPEASKMYQDTIEKQNNSKAQWNSFLVWYDFAAVAEAANRPDDALQYLQEAINRGYKDADGLLADVDLKNLRQNPKFPQLVAELKRTATKAQAQ